MKNFFCWVFIVMMFSCNVNQLKTYSNIFIPIHHTNNALCLSIPSILSSETIVLGTDYNDDKFIRTSISFLANYDTSFCEVKTNLEVADSFPSPNDSLIFERLEQNVISYYLNKPAPNMTRKKMEKNGYNICIVRYDSGFLCRGRDNMDSKNYFRIEVKNIHNQQSLTEIIKSINICQRNYLYW